MLCDPDVVSISNLSRTVLFGPADVGRAKAEAAAEALRGRVPGLTAEPRCADLVSGVGLGELTDADLVIGCVDTIHARIQLLSRCVLVGAPLLDGGTSPWGGEIRVRLSPGEACFACALTAHQRSASDLPWSCAEPMADELPQAAGIATTALTAGWLAAAAFSLLFGESLPYRMLAIDASAGRAAPVTVGRDPQCPLHRSLAAPVLDSPADHHATVAEFLATLGPDDEACTWGSFPVPTRCRRCASSLAADAPDMRCPRCGAVLRETRSTRLRDAAPGTTLGALGVAPEEILPVTTSGGELECHRLRSSRTPATSR